MTTLKTLYTLKQQNKKIACLTAYDASQAHWAAHHGVDVILVGDSLGMVVQGHQTTLPVTLDEMLYHTTMVQRGNRHQAWCMVDLPFMTDALVEQGIEAAARLIKQGGAHMIKLEGADAKTLELVQRLSDKGVPVCGHLGLQPQSVFKKGYQRVGKNEAEAQTLQRQAKALAQAGADCLVLECVPSALAQAVTEQVPMPVIGIGAGPHTDGQVLVWHDVMGMTPGQAPVFSQNFLASTSSVGGAVDAYVRAVKSGHFPKACHYDWV